MCRQLSITQLCGINLQNPALHQLTRYTPTDLKECALKIHDLYLGRKGSSLQAIKDKYKQHKVILLHAFMCVTF